MNTKLTENDCLSSPCKNGGTCTDIFNGFFCKCPPNWTGSNCDEDVNECSEFAGSDLGCQNGATCTNSPGSYRYLAFLEELNFELKNEMLMEMKI